MSWINPPVSVIGVRDCILVMPTTMTYIWPTLNLTQMQTQCFYPRAFNPTDSPALPFMVFRRLRAPARQENAFGSYQRGQVGVSLFWPTALTIDDGTLENYADSLGEDLVSQNPAPSAGGTQFITDVDAGEAIEPTQDMIAGAFAVSASAPLPVGNSLLAISLLISWEG